EHVAHVGADAFAGDVQQGFVARQQKQGTHQGDVLAQVGRLEQGEHRLRGGGRGGQGQQQGGTGRLVDRPVAEVPAGVHGEGVRLFAGVGGQHGGSRLAHGQTERQLEGAVGRTGCDGRALVAHPRGGGGVQTAVKP